MRIRRHVICSLAAVALSLASAATARAELQRLSFEELVRRSELVVCGKVVALRSYWGRFLGRGQLIFTDVTVEITEKMAGETREKTVIVQVPGGRIGDRFLVCPEAPTYRKGERVLLFLRTYNGCCWNTAWAHGKYSLADSPQATDEAVSAVSGSTENGSQSSSRVASIDSKPNLRVRGRAQAPISRHEELDAIRRRVRDVRLKLKLERSKR